MKGARQWFGLAAVLLLMLGALGWLFQQRLGSGDVYPEYSSLRSDAFGTRALFEALGALPGIDATRDYHPPSQLKGRPGLIVLAGLYEEDWHAVPADVLGALANATRNGARVVLAFRADARPKPEPADTDAGKEQPDSEPNGKKVAEGKEAKADPKEKTARKKTKRPGVKERENLDLAKQWGVTLKRTELFPHGAGAERAAGASADLPAKVEWRSEVHFEAAADSGWRVLYRRGGRPVAIEKTMGRGSLVLLGDAYCLSNEAMNKSRATDFIVYLVGDQHRVVFLEGVLGVLEENGIGFLARRYGLGGALALCVLLGLLYGWRRLVTFRPAAGAGGTEEVALQFEPAAGLVGLMRRSLGPKEVMAACVDEWRKSGRHPGVNRQAAGRLEEAWKAHDPQQPMAAAYNALVRALKLR